MAIRKTRSLTEGSIVGTLLLYMLPILLSNLFQQLYNTVDSIVVGRFSGDYALAAVGSSGALINLMIGFFLGLATGSGVVFAMNYGAKNYRELRKVVDNAVILGLIVGGAISVCGVLFSDNLLTLMHTPETVFPLAKIYLQIYLGGTIVNILYNISAGLIRAEGNSRAPLIYLVVGGITNIILDFLLVGAFRLGVVGAASATVASQSVSAILCLLHLGRMDERYRLNLLHMKFDREKCLELIKLSVPCGLQSAMFNISNFLIQVKINMFGDTVMAGVAAYGKIDGFIYMPTNALSLSLSTFVGQNLGAGKYDRVRRGIRSILLIALLNAFMLGMVILLTCPYLLRIFTTEEKTIAASLQMMHFLAPFSWMFTPSDILGSAIRGAGKTFGVTVIMALSICVFRLIWLPVVLHYIHDVRVIYVVYPITWCISTVSIIIFYLRKRDRYLGNRVVTYDPDVI
ncbi:MAG: MATE family efflux transporter [Lachnospiraceae bacterium]|nr:MATE family efflux transporter [Lachnospiraceae bacterium]